VLLNSYSRKRKDIPPDRGGKPIKTFLTGQRMKKILRTFAGIGTKKEEEDNFRPSQTLIGK